MKIMIPKHVRVQQMKGEWVLLDCRKNHYYAINRSGAEVLKQLQDHHDLAKALDTISSIYDIPFARLKEDIRAFIDRLETEGLIIYK